MNEARIRQEFLEYEAHEPEEEESQKPDIYDSEVASYDLAFFIVQKKLPYSFGKDLVEFMRNIFEKADIPEAVEFIKGIACSRNTVVARVEKLAELAKEELKKKIEGARTISLAVDESTDITHTSQLVVFVRGVNPDHTSFEEYLDGLLRSGLSLEDLVAKTRLRASIDLRLAKEFP